MYKSIHLDQRAYNFILKRMPLKVKNEFFALFEVLRKRGTLQPPDGKKVKGHKNLFEIRIQYHGAWRGHYAYLTGNTIIILHCFRKKSQKTPQKEIKTAIR